MKKLALFVVLHFTGCSASDSALKAARYSFQQCSSVPSILFQLALDLETWRWRRNQVLVSLVQAAEKGRTGWVSQMTKRSLKQNLQSTGQVVRNLKIFGQCLQYKSTIFEVLKINNGGLSVWMFSVFKYVVELSGNPPSGDFDGFR